MIGLTSAFLQLKYSLCAVLGKRMPTPEVRHTDRKLGTSTYPNGSKRSTMESNGVFCGLRKLYYGIFGN